MRQLHQDVRHFGGFLLNVQVEDVAKAELLAAAMVGRMKDGDPGTASGQNQFPAWEEVSGDSSESVHLRGRS